MLATALLLYSSASGTAHAANPVFHPALPSMSDNEELNAQLQRVLKDPTTGPIRYIIQGQPEPSPFTQAQIQSGEYVLLKDKARSALCTRHNGAKICLSDVLPGKAPYLDNDRVENLVDNSNNVVRTLDSMATMRLTSARLDETPWSDTYWPIYQGEAANRYADPGNPTGENWKEYFDYDHSPGRRYQDIFNSPTASSVDNLSPAEKYDLLVGDPNGTLASTSWAEGQMYYNDKGSVETWMGICHGWTPASFMEPRPANMVPMLAADGRTVIHFFPSDIKALNSLLWAKVRNHPTRFIGGRCSDKNPERDGNGRVISQECFDTNPGTWHMGVVNQIGVSQRSFIIDATYDYEVWNQPVYGYSYRYFNPITQSVTSSLNDARVKMMDFASKDKFLKYRAHNATAYVVGIIMDITYVVETKPSHAMTNDPSKDAVKTERYMYDLELDRNGVIVGGEWYSTSHPDFMWAPENAPIFSVGDRYATDDWDGTGVMPANWRAAAMSASRYSQPLAKVVDLITLMARTTHPWDPVPVAPAPVITAVPSPDISAEPSGDPVPWNGAAPIPSANPSPDPSPSASASGDAGAGN